MGVKRYQLDADFGDEISSHFVFSGLVACIVQSVTASWSRQIWHLQKQWGRLLSLSSFVGVLRRPLRHKSAHWCDSSALRTSLFEGLKAFCHGDGSVYIFRPDENAKGMQESCKQIMMPELPTDTFVEAVNAVVKDNIEYVPPYGSGGALYIRPLLFGSGPRIGLQPAHGWWYTFLILVIPVGDYKGEHEHESSRKQSMSFIGRFQVRFRQHQGKLFLCNTHLFCCQHSWLFVTHIADRSCALWQKHDPYLVVG